MGNVSLDISIDRIKEITQNAIKYKKIEIERVSKRVLFQLRDEIIRRAKEGESHVYMESYGYCDIEMIKNEFEANGFKVTSEGSNAAGSPTRVRVSW